MLGLLHLFPLETGRGTGESRSSCHRLPRL